MADESMSDDVMIVEKDESITIISDEDESKLDACDTSNNVTAGTSAPAEPAALPETSQPNGGHPCKHLLDNYKPRPYDLAKLKPYPVNPIDVTKRVWVDTVMHLKKVIEGLMQEKEIGVAIRSRTSFLNQLCLVLISTRETDFLIDAIELERHLHLLNQVFLNPEVIKVMEASKTLRHLQTQNVWCVNIFDISLAMRKAGVTNGLSKYVRMTYGQRPGPTYFRSNWDARPLPEDFQKVAVYASHFHLPVYIKMKNRMIDAKVIEPFHEVCNRECALVLAPRSALDSFAEGMEFMQARQVAILYGLQEWRERLARENNCKVDKVMSNNEMLKLARSMPTKPWRVVSMTRTIHAQNNIKGILSIIGKCRQVIGPVNRCPGEIPKKKKSPFFSIKGYCKDKTAEQDNTAEDEVATSSFKTKKNKKGKQKQKQKPARFKAAYQAECGETHEPQVPKGIQFGSGEGGPFSNCDEHPFGNRPGNNLENRFSGGVKRRSNDMPFNNSADEPSYKQCKTTPNPYKWTRNDGPTSPPRQPDRSDSPPTYTIVSDKGESFPVENSNALSRFLGNAKTRSGQKQRRGGDRWQNNSQDNSSTLGTVNSHQFSHQFNSSFPDLNLALGILNSQSLMPNQNNWLSSTIGNLANQGNGTHFSESPSMGMQYGDSSWNRYGASYSYHNPSASFRGGYQNSRRSNVSYPNRSRGSYLGSNPHQSRTYGPY